MKIDSEQNFYQTIKRLEELKTIEASPVLRQHLEKDLIPSISIKKTPLFSPFVFKVGFVSLLFMLLVGGGTIYAAENSHPGQPIYKLKQVVDAIKPLFRPTKPQQNIVITPKVTPDPKSKFDNTRTEDTNKDSVSTQDEIKQRNRISKGIKDTQQNSKQPIKVLQNLPTLIPTQVQGFVHQSLKRFEHVELKTSQSNDNSGNNDKKTLKGGDK